MFDKLIIGFWVVASIQLLIFVGFFGIVFGWNKLKEDSQNQETKMEFKEIKLTPSPKKPLSESQFFMNLSRSVAPDLRTSLIKISEALKDRNLSFAELYLARALELELQNSKPNTKGEIV